MTFNNDLRRRGPTAFLISWGSISSLSSSSSTRISVHFSLTKPTFLMNGIFVPFFISSLLFSPSKASLDSRRVEGAPSFESFFDLFVISIASSSSELNDSLLLFIMDSILVLLDCSLLVFRCSIPRAMSRRTHRGNLFWMLNLNSDGLKELLLLRRCQIPQEMSQKTHRWYLELGLYLDWCL